MEEIEIFLKDRESKGLLRTLTAAQARRPGRIFLDGKEFVDFSSNDYLGLSDHPKIKQAAKEAVEKFGCGACASRLLSGDLQIHHDLEDATAVFKRKPAALVFNSGYQGNLGIISSMYGSGDAIFCDRLSHASIIDGIRLSGGKLFRFRHNDAGHLETLLKTNRRNFKKVLIVTESVFSMDGDIAPLKELAELKEKFNCKLMADEAHATGIFGETGSGIVEQFGLSESVDLVMGTFSKALGGFGGYLACSKKIKDYLVNCCRSFIYSSALPGQIIASDIKAIEIIRDEPGRRRTLLANAEFFRRRLQLAGLDIKGLSQIIPLIVKDSNKAVELSGRLRDKGYLALPIRPPTVAKGQARLRFSLTTGHDKKMLEAVADEIIEIEKE